MFPPKLRTYSRSTRKHKSSSQFDNHKMESAVRYDFSFPPKSSNTNNLLQASQCGANSQMNNHVLHNTGHTIHNVRQQHHDPKFTYNNNNNNVGLPKSASTSLLTCTGASKLNNNYCNNCNNCNTNKDTLNNNNMMQNNLNMKNCLGTNSVKHHSVIKPSALGMMQNQQVVGSIHHGAIVNSINQTVGNAPQTPKDSNCSFSKLEFLSGSNYNLGRNEYQLKFINTH